MSVQHLDDGPFYVSRFKVKPITPKPAASIAALSWAAERESLSYGRFILNLTPADQRRIQAEYEAFQRERRATRARVEIGKTDEDM